MELCQIWIQVNLYSQSRIGHVFGVYIKFEISNNIGFS